MSRRWDAEGHVASSSSA